MSAPLDWWPYNSESLNATANQGGYKVLKVNSKNLCYYGNFTSEIQIARVKNIPNLNFERVVFPGDRLLFEAVPEAQLEVYISKTGREILLKKISCDRLWVNEGINIFELTSTTHSN